MTPWPYPNKVINRLRTRKWYTPYPGYFYFYVTICDGAKNAIAPNIKLPDGYVILLDYTTLGHRHLKVRIPAPARRILFKEETTKVTDMKEPK